MLLQEAIIVRALPHERKCKKTLKTETTDDALEGRSMWFD